MSYITELLGYIGLDVDETSFDQANDAVQDVTKVMTGLITIAASMASAVAGASWSMVNSFAESAVEVDRLSNRLNVSTSQLQEWTYAASAFGIEQDQITDGMKELSMRAAEFGQDGKAYADAFKAIGLSQADVKRYGNDINGLFTVVRDRLSAIQEQGQRQFFSDELFGGGLADVGGEFFSQTSQRITDLQKQAQESGMVISKENIDLAREYTRNMDLLQARIKGLWNVVAGNLLPVFTQVSRQIKEFLDLHGDAIINTLTGAIRGLIESIRWLGVAAAVAMPYIIGASAIAAWGKLIGLVESVRTAFLAMRTGALLAWAAAAAGPALVGAAIIALGLIIQDLYTYFTGGDSITGRILDGFTKPIAQIKTAWNELKTWFRSWIDEVGAWFTDLIPDWIKNPIKLQRQEMIDSGYGDLNERQSSFSYPGMQQGSQQRESSPERQRDYGDAGGRQPSATEPRPSYGQIIERTTTKETSVVREVAPERGRQGHQPARQAREEPARVTMKNTVNAPDVNVKNIVSPPPVNVRNNFTPPPVVIQPPSAAVIAPPAGGPPMAQGMAQANGRTGPSKTNSDNLTVGEVHIHTTQDGRTFSQQFRDELRRSNASTVKGLDTGVQY